MSIPSIALRSSCMHLVSTRKPVNPMVKGCYQQARTGSSFPLLSRVTDQPISRSRNVWVLLGLVAGSVLSLSWHNKADACGVIDDYKPPKASTTLTPEEFYKKISFLEKQLRLAIDEKRFEDAANFLDLLRDCESQYKGRNS